MSGQPFGGSKTIEVFYNKRFAELLLEGLKETFTGTYSMRLREREWIVESDSTENPSEILYAAGFNKALKG